MIVYLVERTDNVDYDEYDSFVVVAENESQALKLISDTIPEFKLYRWRGAFTKENTKFTIVNIYMPGVILGSFNAG